MSVEILSAALEYSTNLHFSVIPRNKLNKKPLIPWTEFQSRIADPEEIKSWWKSYPSANCVVVTGKVSNLLAIDCDTPEGAAIVSDLIPDSLIVPQEITPRGGTHFLFRYPNGLGLRGGFIAKDIEIKGEGHCFTVAPSVNGNGKAYEWVVFPTLENIPEVPEKLLAFILKGIKQWGGASSNKNISLYIGGVDGDQNSPSSLVANGLHPSTSVYNDRMISFDEPGRGETLFHIANHLLKSKMAEENVDKTIRFIAQNCNPPYKGVELETTIKSVVERARKREKPISEDVREFIIGLQVGTFSLQEIYSHLQVSTRDEKKAVWIALKRMEGTLVEKTGTKAGAYRIVNKEIEFMDFVNVSLEGGMDLVMPLGLHEKSIFFPKAVMVVAGVTGHGKTSLVLNIIKDNMNKFDFKYFISEMSPLALNYKLSLFGMPIENWKMQVIPDHAWDYSNIQDKVFPNSINVIDYLEPDGEKSYNIHEVISGIIKRLDKGMAIITTQKKKDVELSAGGIYTAKAASFYLSLDWGTLRIYKNRYREEDKNPQCSKIDFDLKPGVVFEATTEWYNPNSQFKPKQVKAERSYHEHEV